MSEVIDIKQINELIEKESAFVDLITLEMNKVIVGQNHMVESLLIGLLSKGHVLLEGVPGLAKTLAINTLASTISADFSRIQFTPDLLPADVVGTQIYNQKTGGFDVRKGPIFSNFVLADEINRAPAKVQSALLEAMQEKQVTIGDTTYKMEEPFLVMATMNPIEQEGTYPLPEAQVDRFMLKVVITYPNKKDEGQIIRHNLAGEFPTANSVLKPEDIIKAREVVRQVYMDEKIEKYIKVFASSSKELYKVMLANTEDVLDAIVLLTVALEKDLFDIDKRQYSVSAFDAELFHAHLRDYRSGLAQRTPAPQRRRRNPQWHRHEARGRAAAQT